MASVDELQGSTAKITTHLDRLQSVEKDIAALKASTSQKEDVGKVRSEMKKVYVSERREGLRRSATWRRLGAHGGLAGMKMRRGGGRDERRG